jgi:hypothetical protein
MTEESIDIIKFLRESRLGWIADELVETIALGRQISKDFREPGAPRATKGTTIEPLSPDQEMELIVETLAQYFIVIPAAWAVARARFARKEVFHPIPLKDQQTLFSDPSLSKEQPPVALGIAGAGEEVFEDFGQDYETRSLPRLRQVLSKLWPHGEDDFANRFLIEEDHKK